MDATAIGSFGALHIRAQVHRDERGRLSRTWCTDFFAEIGLDFVPRQGCSSLSHLRGTVRGMHYQRSPHAEAKLIRVGYGRIHDMFVDLREDSPDRGRSEAIELDAGEGGLLFLPAGLAHGFQTLTDEVVVEYLMDADHAPAFADGFRWDDPAIALDWPLPVACISEKDLGWPPLAERLAWLNEAVA